MKCREMHSSSVTEQIYSNILCAYRDGHTNESGNIGSPLVVDNKLVGIASWSTNHNDGRTDQFTRISSFIDWIEKEIF